MTWPESIFYTLFGLGLLGTLGWIVTNAMKAPETRPRALVQPSAGWQVMTTYGPDLSQIEAARLLIEMLEEDDEEVPDYLRKLAKEKSDDNST